MKRILFILFAFFLTATVYAEDTRIADMKKRIEAEKAKQAEEQKAATALLTNKRTETVPQIKEDDKRTYEDGRHDDISGSYESEHHHRNKHKNHSYDWDDSDDSDNTIYVWGNDSESGSLFEDWGLIQYSEFPYSDNKYPYFSSFDNDKNVPTTDKYFCFNFMADVTLFGDTTGMKVQGRANALMMHINAESDFYITRKSGDNFSIISAHVGFNLLNLPGFSLAGYIGMMQHSSIETPLLSCGGGFTAFVGYGLNIDAYSRIGFFESLYFVSVNGSINWSINRFTIGIGYEYNNYAGILFTGPSVRLGIWL